jgi:cellulose synthase/poly-beta-1,6-N-acetylglucosamine synthase-like glycosyltransferase
MNILIILLLIAIFIIIKNTFFLIVFPKFNNNIVKNLDYLNISIIIAFKNEEKNLSNLFSALKNLDYPADKYEVILIDDNSSDKSYSNAVEFSENMTNYRVEKAINKKYPGKKGALDIGISIAKFPFILVTDADCMPAKNWLIGYSEKFKAGYDMLFGLAPFKQNQGLVNKLSCFENLRSSLLTFSFAKANLPYSAAARNFGFKISAFKELEGFSNTLETPSGDDDLLIREAVKSKIKIGIVDFDESLVISETENSLKEYLNQKARHTKTSLHYLPIHQALLGLWHLSNIFSLLSIFFIALNQFFSLVFIVKLISDAILALKTQKIFKYNFKLYEILFLQILYEFLLIISFFSSFRKNIIWKN